MVIGQSEDRSSPWGPVMLRHRYSVCDPIRDTHLGQRPTAPRIQAGHMTATDQTHRAAPPLRDRGRPHMDPRFRGGDNNLLIGRYSFRIRL